MQVYSCGNCGYALPGPVGQCPRCHALLRGEREGDEAERLRRERAYLHNRPEAVERRRKTGEALGMIGAGLVVLLVVAIFVGGGAALGWFVLGRFFSNEASLPLSVGGAILGAVLLYPIVWQITNLPSSLPFSLWMTYPDWKREIIEREKAAQWQAVLWSVLLFFLTVPLSGIIGWHLAFLNEQTVRVITLVVVGVLIYGIYRIAKRHDISFDWAILLVLLFGGIGFVESYVLPWLFENPNIGFPLYKPEYGAVVGLLLGTILALYGSRQLAREAPDSREKRQQEILLAVAQDPSRFQDLDDYEKEAVLAELRKLAEAAPEAFKLLSPQLQELVLPRQSPVSRSASERRNKSDDI